MLILKMGWRNIGRNRRRTVVTVGAMAFGLYAMVIWFGMLQGLLNDMDETVVEVELGDLQIHAPTYLDDPSLYTDIDDVDALLSRLEAAGFRANARLVGAGLAAAHDSAAGASLRGLDVQANARVSVISTRLAAGTWLDDGDPAGVVVGRQLARALDLAVGDELVVLSQTTDGGIANDLYAVRGILDSVSEGVDRSAVFLTAAAFRELFVMPTGAHEIVLRKPDELALAAALEIAQGLAPDLDTRSWRSLVPTLVFAESALQTGLALALGLALSVPTLWYLVEFGIDTGALGGVSVIGATFATVWQAVVSPFTFVTPSLTLIVLVLLAVIYPALKAARISPVEAMRHQ